MGLFDQLHRRVGWCECSRRLAEQTMKGRTETYLKQASWTLGEAASNRSLLPALSCHADAMGCTFCALGSGGARHSLPGPRTYRQWLDRASPGLMQWLFCSYADRTHLSRFPAFILGTSSPSEALQTCSLLHRLTLFNNISKWVEAMCYSP